MAEKVLLVDDEKDFLEVMAERMRSRGMEVKTASSPLEALELVAKESFDAIILDLQM
ncbi:MAG: response regulator, partial [Desulfobacterales bacterium]